MTHEFSLEEKKELLVLARTTIETYLKHGAVSCPETKNPAFSEPSGVFVTLHKWGMLRGCIGYLFPDKPLIEAITDNAISASFEDPRFPRVTLSELQDLDIEITILTPPKKVSGYGDVVVSRDGIIISKGDRKGVLLPQVPVEQGWNLEEYISYGCLKAGLPSGAWRGDDVSIETFQGIVFSEKLLGTNQGK